MPFSPKTWQDSPSTSTPISAAALIDLETRLSAYTDASAGGGAVSSVFTRSGAVTAQSGDYAVAQVTGAAPLASPALTGNPTAPTQATADSSTKLATTAFVAANMSTLPLPHVLVDTPEAHGALRDGTVTYGTFTTSTKVFTAKRQDIATVTNASPIVLDPRISSADQGRAVTGTGIPASTFVGTVTPGVSFLLSSSSSSQVNVNATSTHASITITIVLTGQFTSGDVGKVMVLHASASTFVTTIATFTNSSTVVLTADAGSTFQSFACYGTDDTAAVKAAVLGAYTSAIALGLNAAKVQLSQGIYMLAGATTKDHAQYYGNSQIPLPMVAPQNSAKFTMQIEGPLDCSAPMHWEQNEPSFNGATLFSTLLGQSNDTNYGYPSVLGGPTVTAITGYGAPPGLVNIGGGWFDNMQLDLRNVEFMCPFNPSMAVVDARALGCMTIDGVGIFTFEIPANLGGSVPSTYTGGGGCVYFPAINNNDLCEAGTLTIEGYPYGVMATDHVDIQSLRTIYCEYGICTLPGGNSSGNPYHGMHVNYWSCEACGYALDSSVGGGSARVFPVNIEILDTEVISGNIINDSGGVLTGTVRVAASDNVNLVPTVNGAAGLKVIALYQARGHVAAPSVPATTVALLNPFWVDAAVTVAGGTVTVIAVDGTATGLTAGTVIVPSGKTITLTYSVAPTWVWTLL